VKGIKRRHCEAQGAIQSRVTVAGMLGFACAHGLALLVCATLASPALGGTIDDCEKIKDPNAYNLCLASFGPVRGQHGATYPGVATEGDKHGGATGGWKQGASSRHAAPAQPHGGHIRRNAGGRIRMEFTP